MSDTDSSPIQHSNVIPIAAIVGLFSLIIILVVVLQVLRKKNKAKAARQAQMHEAKQEAVRLCNDTAGFETPLSSASSATHEHERFKPVNGHSRAFMDAETRRVNGLA